MNNLADIANLLFIFFSLGPYIALPCVIVASMTIIYRRNLALEENLDKDNEHGEEAGLRGPQRKNHRIRQSRAILNRASAFSLAFFLTYLFPIIISIRTLSGYTTGHALSILARMFFPLQGFFNFVIFVHPMMVAEKTGAKEPISWLTAFKKALNKGYILGSRKF